MRIIKMISSLIRLKSYLSATSTFKMSLNSLSTSGLPTTDIDTLPMLTEKSDTIKPFQIDHGHVYFVATPIGNMQDVSKRMFETLSQVDIICAEDTRHTRNLLSILGIIPKKLISHHEHNYLEQIPRIMEWARTGKSIAIVSDAGTPGISDPGAQLAETCLKNQITIHPIPGPSAVVSALSVSGFPSSEFTFLGFIPVKGKERSNKLIDISNCRHTVVFFEAPHRILDTLSELAEKYGQQNRDITCCRELTKMHEEIIGGMPLSQCLQQLQSRDQENTDSGNTSANRIRGEFTVVLGPVKHVKIDESEKATDLLRQLRDDGVTRSEAVKLVTDILSLSKSIVYKMALSEHWPASSSKPSSKS